MRLVALLLAVAFSFGCVDADEAEPRPSPASTQVSGTGSPDGTSAANPKTETGAPVCELYAPKDVCSSTGDVVDRGGCPFPACSCPAHCQSLEATIIDANKCSRKAVLGCIPRSTDAMGTSTDGKCYQREEDGLMAGLPSVVTGADGNAVATITFMPGWAYCSSEKKSYCDWEDLDGPQCQ